MLETMIHSLGSALEKAEVFQRTGTLKLEDEHGAFLLEELDRSILPEPLRNALSVVGVHPLSAEIFGHRPDWAFANLGPHVVVSVGSIREHSEAKATASLSESKTPVSVVAVPLDLRNDGFLTDRYSNESSPSNRQADQGRYPSLVLIDLQKIQSFSGDTNRFGVGEAVSLLVSARDALSTLGSKRRSAPETELERLLLDLISSWKIGSIESLHNLLHCLTIKALFMRATGTNLVGAGPDHLLSYALENNGILLEGHGCRVLLGALIAGAITNGALLPIDGAETLARFGDNQLFWHRKDTRGLFDMNWHDLLQSAIHSRPRRITGLNQVSQKQIDHGKELMGEWFAT